VTRGKWYSCSNPVAGVQNAAERLRPDAYRVETRYRTATSSPDFEKRSGRRRAEKSSYDTPNKLAAAHCGRTAAGDNSRMRRGWDNR